MDKSVDASFVSCGSYSSGSSAGELESDIGRAALKEICCSVLSRILDLSDNKLEVLLGGDQSDAAAATSGGSNVARNIANKFRSISHKLKFDECTERVDCSSVVSFLPFGATITEDSEGILLQLMTHMEEYIDEEGLFRKSGSKSRVAQLVTDLETTPFQSVLTNETYSPHDFASVFKQYFGSLPEPLMLNRHIEAYRQASELQSDSSRTLCLQLLVLLLPPSHHNVLYQLLNFLSVVAHSEDNKMDAHNLSVVFAPNLFLDMKCSDNVVPELIPKMMSLLQYMIKHYVDIFEIPIEVRDIAERYMKRKGTKPKNEVDIPLDICSSSCQQSSLTSDEFHESGRDNATAELAALYEHVCKMPEGPQKQYFMKKFNSSSKMAAKMAGSPAPFTKCKKGKENFTPKVKLQKGVGSHHVCTPLRPSFASNSGKLKMDHRAIQAYATPLKPTTTANLTQYQKLETDV